MIVHGLLALVAPAETPRRMDGDGDGDHEQKRVFAYDGNQIVLDFQHTGAGDAAASDLCWRYLWDPAVDQILAEEEVDGGTDDMVQWTLTDHLNTVRDIAKYNPLTDTTTVVNHLVYDAFGNVTSETNPAVDSLFLFTARPFDADTGLQNNLNRWYDPAVGRWLSEDPMQADINLYRYCTNDALMKIDPNGLVKDDIRFINYLAKKYGLSPEGRDALHEALAALKGPGGLASKEAAEEAAQSIRALGGKFIKGGGTALSVLFAWLAMEGTAQAEEIPHDWREGGTQWWGTQQEKCECARFQASLIVPSWWAVFGEVEWGGKTQVSRWFDFGCMDVEDCRALEDEPRVIDETRVTGYTIYNTSRVRCRFGGVLYGPPPMR